MNALPAGHACPAGRAPSLIPKGEHVTPSRETVVRNLWAAPSLFIAAAFIAFILVRSDAAVRAGWILYFLGWLPPLIALAICTARKESPGPGGAFAFVALIAFGGIFWLNHA
ncbi:hypothetical protein [Streptomyces tsukubensis]|uniref:hypothetical protein n=1 Tax=Streptomyces tsukubensis TaxID=83656 RepID=UPI00344B67F5